MTLRKGSFENIVGKGENAGNQYFLLLPTMLSTLPKPNFNAFNLDQSKILPFGKELKLVLMAFPHGVQDYGNSTMTGWPLSGKLTG